MDYQRVAMLIKTEKKTQLEAAKAAGMKSAVGLLKAINKETLTIKSLEGLCELYQVQVCSFFENTEQTSRTEQTGNSQKKYIEERVKELEQQCKELKKKVQELERKA